MSDEPSDVHRWFRADLEARWRTLADELDLAGDGIGLRDTLLASYSEPHRHHHDLRHLDEVLAALDTLSDSTPSTAVRLAAWFHDAVYAGHAGDDERASAELARTELPLLDVDDRLVDATASMVEATARHLAPGEGPAPDPDTALLLDADLWILASSSERYGVYAAGIRAEHPEVDDETFRRGRLAALRTLEGRRSLFHTDRGRELDEAARDNIRQEIDRLSGPEDAG